MLNSTELHLITELRHELHRHPELSGQEVQTRGRLMAFIKQHTALTVTDMGSWFYAHHRGKGPSVAFRADMDALPMEEGITLPWGSQNPGVAHKCGHDGHSAALSGLALLVERLHPDRDVYLIFQPAEEIGAGGRACADFILSQHITSVFGCHNWSGFPEGQVLTRNGLAMCGSLGLTVTYHGVPAHASFPEDGKNPVMALSSLALYIESLAGVSAPPRRDMELATIVGMNCGAKNFGLAAAEGSLSCTLRAGTDDALSRLTNSILLKAQQLADLYGLTMESANQDIFPAVINDPACAEKALAAAAAAGLDTAILPRPFRTSEDFGYYTAAVPGAMLFIGNGPGYPPIHTTAYDFPDGNLDRIASLFYAVLTA